MIHINYITIGTTCSSTSITTPTSFVSDAVPPTTGILHRPTHILLNPLKGLSSRY